MGVKKYDSLHESKSLKSLIFINHDMLVLLGDILALNRDNQVSRNIAEMFSSAYRTEFISPISYISLSDKNDELEYVPISKLKYPDQYNYRLFDKNVYAGRQVAKVGRLVRKFLEDNGKKVDGSELESFVNYFKQTWEVYKGTSNIEIVQGSDIKKWYHANNYSAKTTSQGYGSLGKSCMSGGVQQSFLKVYEENPDVVKMIIQKDSNGRLTARALFWKIDFQSSGNSGAKYYLDRVYYTMDYQYGLIKDYFFKNIDKNGYFYTNRDDIENEAEVSLKNWNFELYPYMDSFQYLNFKTGKLSNFRPKVDRTKVPLVYLRSLNGKSECDYWVYSRLEKKFIREKYAHYDKIKKSYITNKRGKFISLFKNFLPG